MPEQSLTTVLVTVAACACVGMLGVLTYMATTNRHKYQRTDEDEDEERYPPSSRVHSSRRRSRDSDGARGTTDQQLRQRLKALHETNSYEVGAPSMEDVIQRNSVVADQLEQMQPREVLQRLQEGNARFWMGLAERPEMSAMERRALIMQQTPKVAILGCSDSRVPIEIVFDQGLGDVFAIRVAGNLYGHNTAASIDYAVAHLKVKLIVILGHEGCGAVKAATLPDSEINKESPDLRSMLFEVKRGLSQHGSLARIRDKRAKDREAVVTNVFNQMQLLGENEMISGLVATGKLLVVGAFYEISSGQVDFFEWKDMIDSMAEAQAVRTPLLSPQLSDGVKQSLMFKSNDEPSEIASEPNLEPVRREPRKRTPLTKGISELELTCPEPHPTDTVKY